MGTDIYPLMFQGANDFIKFTASVPSGGDAQVKFRFEYNPHPDVDPAYDTDPVTVSGADNVTYKIDIPDQGPNTYSSFLLYIVDQDVPVDIFGIRIHKNAVLGCTDDTASNYNSSATVDDDSCTYDDDDDESNASDDSSDDDSTTYIIVGVVVGVVAVVGVIAAVTMLAGSGSGAAVSTAS